MRNALWPGSPDEHDAEIERFLSRDRAKGEVFLALGEEREAVGFLEARLRSHAEGCSDSPVPYVEGWWVDPDWRGRGVGAALMAALEAWARQRGFREIASDAESDNVGSQRAHRALGFEETDRIVCFRKTL